MCVSHDTHLQGKPSIKNSIPESVIEQPFGVRLPIACVSNNLITIIIIGFVISANCAETTHAEQ